MQRPQPTGREVFFGDEEIIVSKTNLRGQITYANEVFVRISGFTHAELIGAPHSLIRHPQMPRCVFKLLWDTIQGGQEIFAYVVNLAKNGDHYWVLAHVTPTFDTSGAIVGYHSNRRCPDRQAINAVVPLYAQLQAIEQKVGGNAGMAAAQAALVERLTSLKATYDEWVWSLNGLTGAVAC